MVRVSYQVIFRGEDFREVLKSILEETFEDVFDEFIESIPLEEISIEIKYYYQVPNSEICIIGFSLDLPEVSKSEEWEYIDKFIRTFNKELLKNDNIDTAFKFYDENLLNQLEKLYKEIFEVEMKLREVLTFIFIDNYKDDNYYDLLRDYKFNNKSSLYSLYPNLKNVKQKEEFLKKKLENEFFYLLFSNYKEFKKENLKELNNKDLVKYIQNAEDFNKYKEIIENRGIIIPEYEDFLLSIEEDLNNLEKIRNCVAHNRTPTKKELENYEKAVKDIKNKINTFLDNINSKIKPSTIYIEELIKPKVIFATIYVEEMPNMPGVYRQNATTLEFENGEIEEVDIGDEMIHGDNIYEVEDDFKKLLLNYLKENGYDVSYLDKSNIEIEKI
ncbi:hypothetical protein [Methanocaldococcus fervens]|uniref:Swt1-like HEPN domain-containing protein n=1 Tax=Methanocaldococcus fervens (strain DSM 4213 / JCM 15782 / AG86) TaxID=573064 RepID=C7P733_METFA|nr:hypothetical protein [Methanocaldococcus fervens]ACV24365.1 hypothetical protein Mefer_0544 [Methanocaldococcus fervens AG86]